jgi:GMP synthase (glutamine-hydrolysing)
MNESNLSAGENDKSKRIVILDAGGQYCHLIARKVRELGIYAEIKPSATPHQALEEYQALIISGGPASVYSHDRPKIDEKIFDLRRPILGICYGHQIMTEVLGGHVREGTKGEYGIAELEVSTEDSLFKGISGPQRVWMSHRDVVEKVPQGFEVIASTEDCRVAAMANFKDSRFGLQFHPEVRHTEYGVEILRNFIRRICKLSKFEWQPTDQISRFVTQIKETVGERNVFFLVSGGVDSTVAFTLCVKALGKDRVKGLYVDTGFMRKYDTDAMRKLIASGQYDIKIVDAGNEFIEMLKDIQDPEIKRKEIGKKFVALTDEIMTSEFKDNRDDWVLGQGTIYPDTIESGGTKHAAHIKTHHNRVGLIKQLILENKVVEPLSELYKDEVRKVGRMLAKEFSIPRSLINRHPFPGPGLAIRCLVAPRNRKVGVAANEDEQSSLSKLEEIASRYKLQASTLPIRTVGVKGDERSYDLVALLAGPIPSIGDESIKGLEKVSSEITNNNIDINRVTYYLSDSSIDFKEWEVRKSYMDRSRISLLQTADNLVAEFMEANDLARKVWQFPVVLIPLGHRDSVGETIVLRPIDSVDGMTAQVSLLPIAKLRELAALLRAKVKGIDAVLLDVTNKPPATIEWE